MLSNITRLVLAYGVGLALVGSGVAQGPNWVERLASYPAELVKDKKTDAEVAEILFQAAMKRAATPKDKDVVAQHLARAKVRETGCQDVLWALINTKEFAKAHGLTVEQALELGNKITDMWEKKK
jgi:hypothetical protein